MWRNLAETPGDGIDNDGNGVVDDVFGLNAYHNNGDPLDTQGHGTHCAGTIGARGDNGVGITGVAWEVRLLAGKFLGPAGGTTSDAIKTIDYARQNGAHIINASWGGRGNSIALRNAIAACANANIPFVAAAGNSGTNNDSLPFFPASYDLPNIVSVAATNGIDWLTDFSCHGANSVDLGAPGWQIWSTYVGSSESYRYLHGTSMAAPHVSGALALARAQFPAAAVDELIERLHRSVDALPALAGKVASGGRLNLHRLLTDNGTYLPNDRFDEAFPLSGDFATWSGGNHAATRDPDENSYSPVGGARTLWFAWQAPYDGFAAVGTSSLGGGQRVVVFGGETRGSLRMAGDSGLPPAGAVESTARFFAEAGRHYRIVTASDSPGGELFSLRLELIAVAANDLLSQALEVAGESFELAGSNRGATAQPFETAAPHAGVGAGHSVWFAWTAPFSGPFSLNTEGSDTDTVVAVYSGDPADPGSFTPVSANDDVSPTHRWSRVDVAAAAGTTYFIAVDTAMGGVPGTFILRGASPAPPSIASEPADLDVAVGGRAVLSVGAEGTPPLRYQWFRNEEALPGAWGRTLTIDPVASGSFGDYQVVVGNSFGTTASRNARLMEVRFAPAIAWLTGDIAVLAGQDTALAVQAAGSEPMSYSWTKDGEPLAGRDQPSLPLAAASSADKGIYVCTVANDQGTTSATMVLSVVNSPFDSFTAVRESAPNSAIASLSVIEGKCYAVASERILVSADGRAWIPWQLPGGFDGSVVAKLDGKWFCAGFGMDGKLSMAISHDGAAWDDPVPITGVTIPYGAPNPFARLVSFDGRLVAAQTPVKSAGGVWQAAGIYHSSDGINWTPARHRRPDNSIADLAIKCRFEPWGGRLYAPGNENPSSVLASLDGITWQESLLPVGADGASYGAGNAIGTSGGRLRIVCNWGTYSTGDGTTWAMDGRLIDHSSYFGRQVVSSAGMTCAFTTYSGSDIYLRGTSTVTWGTSVVNPRGHQFSAAAEFDGAILYGTSTGLLRRVTGPEDFTGTPEEVYQLSRIEFINNEFLAYRSATIAHNIRGPLQISGDARRWRSGKSFSTGSDQDETVRVSNLFLGGRYFTAGNAGWLPAALAPGGLPNGVAGAQAAATDGTRWLVVGSSQQTYSVSLDGSSWTPHQATGLSAGSTTSLVHFNGRWFLTNRDSGTANLYRSEDGIAWSTVAGLVPRTIAIFNGKLVALDSWGSTLHESSDGLTWSSFPTGIVVGTPDMYGTNYGSALRLLVFDGKLITMVRDAASGRSYAFFSEDGRTWFRGRAPVTLQDLAVGHNMLVGVAANGSVLVSGGTGTGGAAPLVNITYPTHKSTHVNGTMVEIRGTAVDPEGQPVTTECIVDGVSIGTTTAGHFRFQFRAANPAGHVVSVRGRDPAGIVGSDEIKVFASLPQLRNDFESAEGETYLPQVAWTSFGGRAYAAGPYSLHRTRGDGTWEAVLLPSLPGPITNLVSGNGTLILQTSATAFATRDGVVWTQLGKSPGGMIAFRGGWFLGTVQTAFSQDGLSWNFGSNPLVSGTWSPFRLTVTPGGSLLVTPPYRSLDGGANWIPMPELGNANSQSLQFATAFGAVFASSGDGRVMRSEDDGRSWQEVARFEPLPAGHGVRLALHAERLFWGGGGYWLAGSDDGTSWRLLENEPLQSSLVARCDGRFVGFGRSGMVWSANGYVWQPAKDGPQNPTRDMLAEDGDALLLGDSNGGLWRATDGRTWVRVMPGRPVTAPPPASYWDRAATCLQMGATTVVGGSPNGTHYNTFLWYSENGGLDWHLSTFHGGAFSGVIISDMWTDGGVAFAATTRILSEGPAVRGLWRSGDGRDWHQLWSWPGGAVANMRFHGGEWWCLGTGGGLHRSTDNGASWGPDIRPPELLAGLSLIRFDGAWIVTGTETTSLPAPNVVHVTTDGHNWTRHEAPGGETDGGSLEFATNGDTLVVSSSSGLIYTATDRNLEWMETAMSYAFTGEASRVEVIGGKFVVPGEMVSDDGFEWTGNDPDSPFELTTPELYFKGLYLAFRYSSRPHWSPDGVVWTEAAGGHGLGFPLVPAAGPDILRVRHSSGAVWETADGMTWTQVREGAPDTAGKGYARRIVSHGGRLLATGTEGLLLYSEDDGRSWQPGLLNGRQLPATLNEREIKTSPTEVLAVFEDKVISEPALFRHFRSEDGCSWTELPGLATLKVMDYAWGDDRWIALCLDGSLLQSIDGGITWGSLGRIPGVRVAGRLAHIAGRWVAACIAATPAGNAPIQLHGSADGLTWTHLIDTGPWGSYAGDLSRFFTGHGYLHYGILPSPASFGQFRSTDGINWSTMIKGGSTNKVGFSGGATWYLPVAEGYIAFDSIFTTNPHNYWRAPVEGGDWQIAPLLQNQIRWLGTPDGRRLFLFGEGIIKEWTGEDLDLAVTDPAPAVIGVGDGFALSATLRNLGGAAMNHPIRVNAWLSSDRFFGDGNDVFVGWTRWDGAAPEPGSATTRDLSFTLPDSVRPGAHHVILELEIPPSYRESNRANNTAITGTTVVTIPQRRLRVTAEGNGSVLSDQNAEFHPHGARIAFVATPGKGARFAGWGGDAVGSLSETLVIMDADKNVEARFVATAALTVFTRGGGSVLQAAEDGIYLAGETASLTAVALPGWTFSGWSGALSGNQATAALPMDSNKVVTARFSLPFDAWQALVFPPAELADPAISGPAADADGDDLENWREWLRGSHPKDRASRGQGPLRREGNWLAMTYTRLENMPAGHAVRAAASADLATWNLPVEERVIGSTNGVETIEARVNATGLPMLFLRTTDTRPQP
jgi:hypothetical protein